MALLPAKTGKKKGTAMAGVLGDGSAFIDWARGQNILVGGAAVLGMSLGIGFAVSSLAVWLLNKAK